MRRLALALCLVASVATATTDEWELLDEDLGVRVWRKAVPDSAMLAFRGEGIGQAPPARILSAILDLERGPRWVHLLTHSTVLQESRDGEAILYNRYDSPWPLQDRDFVLHRSVRVDPAARAVTVAYRSTRHAAMPEQSCCIRGLSELTVWTFSDLGDGRTRMQVEVLSDPRGSIPAAVVNLFQRSWPRQSILGLEAEAKRPDVVPHPLLAGW